MFPIQPRRKPPLCLKISEDVFYYLISPLTRGCRQVKVVFGSLEKNCRFDVPLSLDVIHARLENNYYRSVEAMKHDISVMLSNAEAYFFDKKAELSTKMKRLSDWFDRTLSSL